MKIRKVANRKWYSATHKKSFEKLAGYVMSHYPKDAQLHKAVSSCYKSFDDASWKLAKSMSKAKRPMRKARRAPSKRVRRTRRTRKVAVSRSRKASKSPKRRVARRRVARRTGRAAPRRRSRRIARRRRAA